MIKTVSMINNVDDTKVKTDVVPGLPDKYPWGLRITLNGNELDKLGLDVSDFPVGTDFTIQATARVTEVRSLERENDQENTIDNMSNEKSVSFQITDLGLQSSQDFEGAFQEAVEEE